MQDRRQDFFRLREKHPIFSYLGFSWNVDDEELKVRYHFSDGENEFFPEYVFTARFAKEAQSSQETNALTSTHARRHCEGDSPKQSSDNCFSGLLRYARNDGNVRNDDGNACNDATSSEEHAIENFLFHIGLCEVISYWKASCAPILDIHPFCLDAEAERWWKKLFYNGLGEFRYLNGIECAEKDFVQFRYSSKKTFHKVDVTDNAGILLPIGGGKDSAVTLELLSQSAGRESITPFMLNGIPASRRTIVQAGFPLEKSVNVTRTLDPTLLKLNADGYLNGHTPFSALLAFVTLFAAFLYKKRDIALSNESSANEATIPGTNINHQYSKSFEFETDFRNYCQRYMASGLNYYSFLRSYTESDIAKIFSTFPQHFHSFRSCNAGSKSDVWCCNCSKCLFVWIILSPYLSVEQLTAIFGKDLGADFHLLEDFKKLCGLSPEKPFECVGTIEEVRNSIVAACRNGHQDGHQDNMLYRYFMEQKIYEQIN